MGSCTLYYDANGGSGGPSDQTYTGTDFPHTFTIPNTAPKWSGHTFLGWGSKPSNPSRIYPGGATIMLGNGVDKTLYAQWDGSSTPDPEPEPEPEPVWKTYILSYNTNGGSNGPNRQSAQATKGYVDFVISNVVPTRAGHTFKGWATSSTASSPDVGSTFRVTDAMDCSATIYAVWTQDVTPEPTKYWFRLRYNANGGTGAPEEQSHYGAESQWSFTISNTIPTNGSIKFLGWGTKAENPPLLRHGGEKITIGRDVTMTLYAQWEQPKKVERIEITGPSELPIGSSAEYIAESYPANAELRTISQWFKTSSDGKANISDIHTTSTGGRCTVTAVEKGQVTISAQADDSPGVGGTTGSFTINIIPKSNPIISGPKIVSGLTTQRYTAGGFSNPDAIDWRTDNQEASVIAGTGATADIEFSKNENYDVTIFAETGDKSEVASLKVSVKRGITSLVPVSPGQKSIRVGEKVPEEELAVFMPGNADPTQLSFSVSGGSHCKVSNVKISSTTEKGWVEANLEGLSEGTDVLTITNGAFTVQYTVMVTPKAEVSSISITGPTIAIDRIDSVRYETTTSPTPEVAVDIHYTTSNLTTPSGVAEHTKAWSIYPKLENSSRDGYLDVWATLNGVSSKKIHTVVTLGSVKSVEIIGENLIKENVKCRFESKLVLDAGDPARFARNWEVNGDAEIVGPANNNYVDVRGILNGKESGFANIILHVDDKTATRENVPVLPSLKKINLKGSPYVDIGASFRLDVAFVPEKVHDRDIAWTILEGRDNIKLESHKTETETYAIITGLKTGFAELKAYSVRNPEGVYSTFRFKVNGDVFGSPEAPLDSVNMSLDECLGDTIYAKMGATVELTAEHQDYIEFYANSLSPLGIGIGINPNQGVSGILERPGEITIIAYYWDQDVYEASAHTIKLYSIAPKGLVSSIVLRNAQTIVVGETVILEAEALPEDAINKKISWELISGTANVRQGIAADTLYGGTCHFTGLNEGESILKISSADGSGAFINVPLQIKNKPDAADIPFERADHHVVSYISAHHNGKTTRLMLPLVTSIEDIHTTTLSEISTVVYGSSNRFIMDMGSSKRYNVSVRRVNPPDYNDADAEHPERWSNGKWYNELKHLLDFWQNFGETPNPEDDPNKPFLKTGGFMFHYMPPRYDEEGDAFRLFPEIHEVVFMIGSLNPRFGVDGISLTLPLQVARMTGRSKVPSTREAVFMSNTPSKDSFTQFMPQGVSVPMPLPIDAWRISNNNLAFKYWAASNGSVYYAGQPVLWTDTTPYLYYAQWEEPILTIMKDAHSGSIDFIEIPVGATHATAYIIGGGGGGAGGGKQRDPSAQGDAPTGKTGGAGGGGDLVQVSFNVEHGGRIEYYVGAGGAGGEPPFGVLPKENGQNGGKSYIKYYGIGSIVANGGFGGTASTIDSEGLGGAQFNKGGNGAKKGQNGFDGVGKKDGTRGFAGRGGYAASSQGSAGGSGGGCPDFSMNTAFGTITSKGGAGSTYAGGSYTGPQDGEYGGGGGSGPRFGAAGGTGLVLIVFFG